MKKEVILAHDLGTTGNKASLYNLTGHLIQSYYFPYKTYYPKPGWVEQSPDDWWEAFLTATKEVLNSSNTDPAQVLGISFSGQMMSSMPVDQKGNLLQKQVCIWADHRSETEAEIIRNTIGWENFYHATGAGMEIAIYPIAKILWLKENDPDTYRRTYKFLGVKDILINRLTGRFVTDYSDASNTGMLNIHKKTWSSDILAEIGIDINKLPDILPSSTVVGSIGKMAGQETGLKEGTPIVLGGGDVACAALGAGVIREGSVYNYIGSASWLAVAATRPIFDDKMRPFSLCHIVPNMHVVQLAMFSAGVAYDWFKDQLCWLESAFSQHSELDAFDIMNKEASDSAAGANGLIFLPDMRPGGAPHNNLKARGALVGLTLSHKKGDILRSVLEGITFNIRLMSEAMEQQVGVQFKEVRMIGGGSKSQLWREIEASILNKKICIFSAQQEANSLGAAILAGVGLGVFEGFEQAINKLIKVTGTTTPDKDMVKVYDCLFPLFNQAYESLTSVNSDLGDFVAAKLT